MRAKPMKLVPVEGYIPYPIEEATQVKLNFQGPSGTLHLPVALYAGAVDG